MAKATIRGARLVGPTLFTERLVERPDGDNTIYVEAWRQRSDRMVQTRILRTRPAEGCEGHPTEHRGSAFRNLGKLGPLGETPSNDITRLRAWLAQRGATITKEMGF